VGPVIIWWYFLKQNSNNILLSGRLDLHETERAKSLQSQGLSKMEPIQMTHSPMLTVSLEIQYVAFVLKFKGLLASVKCTEK